MATTIEIGYNSAAPSMLEKDVPAYQFYIDSDDRLCMALPDPDLGTVFESDGEVGPFRGRSDVTKPIKALVARIRIEILELTR